MKFNRPAILFSTKLFIAAMIAFAIAVKIDLPQPYWCVVTCCIVMNPMTGAVRSKAAYRLIGTVCGGLMALLLSGLFSSIPFLLFVACGILVTAALICSVLDRTPRSYGFMLSGVTLMLIVISGLDHPETIFGLVVARVSEISLGIVSVTMVDNVLAPSSYSPALHKRLLGWLPNIEAWTHGALSGEVLDPPSAFARLQFLTDVSSLSALAGQLRYDPALPRRDLQLALAVQRRLLRLAPILSAIAARVASFGPAEHRAMDPLLTETKARLQDNDSFEQVERFWHGQVPADGVLWQVFLYDSLADLLVDAVRILREVRSLVGAFDNKQTLDPYLTQQMQQATPFRLVPDYTLALRIGGGILVTYILLAIFWWATGWSGGATAVILGTVSLVAFGVVDDPGPAIAKFGVFVVVAFAATGILAYGLLPVAHNYPSFLLAMALFMVPLGIVAASNPIGALVIAIGLSSINLQAQYAPPDFGSYLEAMFADLLGIFVAFACAGLFRPVGTIAMLAHFSSQDRRDIARLSQHATLNAVDDYVNRGLDRIASITGRLTAGGEIEHSAELLRYLRAGVSIATLRVAADTLTGSARSASEDLLAEIRSEIKASAPSHGLLAFIDRALSAAWRAHPDATAKALLRALVGLRLALFESAPGWTPS